jgi:SAM-dependent methyltransferase
MVARRLGFLPLDLIDAHVRPRDRDGDPIPPRRLENVGGAYDYVGDLMLSYFVDLCQLRSTDDVLDIGCGVGRVARALAHYLEASARYEGFDIVADSIRWCEKNLTTRYPNFHFQLAEIQNKYYRRHRGRPASEFRFPYDDRSFDFTFATSVFTHMLPDETRRYISETARTVRPGGRVAATFVLLNDEVYDLADADRGWTPNLRHRSDDVWLASRDTPEALVAVPEKRVRDMFAECGLDVTAIHFGSWPGRPDAAVSGQDLVVAQLAG